MSVLLLLVVIRRLKPRRNCDIGFAAVNSLVRFCSGFRTEWHWLPTGWPGTMAFGLRSKEGAALPPFDDVPGIPWTLVRTLNSKPVVRYPRQRPSHDENKPVGH